MNPDSKKNLLDRFYPQQNTYDTRVSFGFTKKQCPLNIYSKVQTKKDLIIGLIFTIYQYQMIFFSNQTIYIYKQVKAGCEFRVVEAGELLDADSNSAHSLIKAFTLYCECMAYQVGLRAWLGNLGHCCSKCASFFLKTKLLHILWKRPFDLLQLPSKQYMIVKKIAHKIPFYFHIL